MKITPNPIIFACFVLCFLSASGSMENKEGASALNLSSLVSIFNLSFMLAQISQRVEANRPCRVTEHIFAIFFLQGWSLFSLSWNWSKAWLLWPMEYGLWLLGQGHERLWGFNLTPGGHLRHGGYYRTNVTTLKPWHWGCHRRST